MLAALKRSLAVLVPACLFGCAPVPPQAYAAAGAAILGGLTAWHSGQAPAVVPGAPGASGGLPGIPGVPLPPGLSPGMQVVYMCLALAMFGFATLKGGKS